MILKKFWNNIVLAIHICTISIIASICDIDMSWTGQFSVAGLFLTFFLTCIILRRYGRQNLQRRRSSSTYISREI